MTVTTMAIISVPGIIAITNLLKKLGVSGAWSALAAVLLGVGLSLAQWALADTGGWKAATEGLALGLAAAGLWDVTKPATTGAVTP